MTSARLPVAPETERPPRATHRRTLRPTRTSWPLWTITAGVPLAFGFGLHGLVWPIASTTLAVRVLAHRTSLIPWSTVPLVIFVCWAPLSVAVLGLDDLPIFGYRFALFVGCLAAAIWVANVDEEALPTTQIIDWLAVLWITTVAFGYLAQVLPHLDGRSPAGIALGPLGRIDFVARISDWRLADNHTFQGRAFSRPAAPWAASNSWGAAVAVLTPFFVRSWLVDVTPRRRATGWVLLVASGFPILLSANRGLWIGLTIGFGYLAVRQVLRGHVVAIAILLAVVALIGVLLAVTPAGALVADRLGGSGESNRARAELYLDAWRGAGDSPLVGNGVPRATDHFAGSPPVGTHGLLWYLMFIHGFVGLALFLGWLAIETIGSGRATTPDGWCAHLGIVVAVVLVPYYGLLPHVLLVGVAVGIAHREVRRPATEFGHHDAGSDRTMPRRAVLDVPRV